MQTQNRRRDNLLGEAPPLPLNIELCNLLQDSYYSKCKLRASYQRQISWSKNQMNDFIEHIMNNGLVPPITQYKLSNEEKEGENTGIQYEIVDGQHRLFTLKAFYDATFQECAHIKNKFIVYWNYQHNQHIFYRNTQDVQDWCVKYGKHPYFLTTDEKEHFDSFMINITRINNPIEFNKRKQIFTSMQKGVPVRNSDLLKNKTGSTFITFICENYYEEMMNDTFLQHCTKHAPKYWVNWSCRCFFLWKATKKTTNEQQMKDAVIAFSTTDNKIGRTIQSNSEQSQVKFNPSNDDLSNFDDSFRAFILFLKDINIRDVTFNPTQIFALFYCSCTSQMNDIISHMFPFSQRGISKKDVWESNTDLVARQDYFKECVEQIKEYYPSPPMVPEEAEDYYEIREF
jgi:hypothetical protein